MDIFREMKTHEFSIVCPHCGRENELASEVTGKNERPQAEKKGSISVLICFNCAWVFALDANSNPRQCTANELEEMLDDHTILKALGMVRLAYQRKELLNAVDRDENRSAGE